MRKTRQDAEHTREAILDAAEQVFYDHGVAGGSLEEVARVAGVTRGAVYWHFTNKLHIFNAIGERAVLPHEEALRGVELAGRDDLLAVLEQMIATTFVTFGQDECARIRLTVQLLRCDYVGDMAPALQGHAALIHRLSGQVARIFCDLPCPSADGAEWHPEIAAKAFASLLHGTLMLWLRSPGEFALGTVGVGNVQTFVQMMRQRWWPMSHPLT